MAFILGGRSSNGLAFTRSLGRKGIPVVAIDSVRGPGSRSRYCVSVEASGSIGSEQELLGFLDRAGKRLRTQAVLIPTHDEYVLFVSRHRASLSDHYAFVIAGDTTLETIINKKAQYLQASSLGVPIPQTYVMDGNADIHEIAQAVTYPCLIKPASSHQWGHFRQREGIQGWLKLAQADSPTELIRYYTEMARSGIELLVQERIGGGDDQIYSVWTYFSRTSLPLAMCVRRKLRQWPVDYGYPSFATTTLEPSVVDLSMKLLTGIRYQGLANVEFKKDPRDGKFRLMEINPRSGMSEGLAIDSGVDTPHIAYRDALGLPVEPVDTYRVGVKWINLGWDINSYRQRRHREGLSFWTWARSVAGARSYAYFAWDDPLPAVAGLWGAVKEALAARVAPHRMR